MRVADKMGYDQVNSGLTKNRSDLARLQNEAATQKRIGKPSDDPLATTRVLQARTEIAGGTQFLKSIEQARTFLEYSEQSLTELSDLLVRAKELAISQANDASAGRETRLATAQEVSQLYDQSVQVGNRKLGDRFLFAGYRTTKPPFDVDGKYHGDSGEMKIAVNKDALIAMNIPGNHLFLGESVTAPLSAGPSAAPKPDATEPKMRGPASIAPGTQLPGGAHSDLEKNEELDPLAEPPTAASSAAADTFKSKGVNIFATLRDLDTGLRTNDKAAIQDSLESLDEAIGQVVLARAQLGARVNSLNNARETLQKGQVDTKALASNLEDADTFELVSDINKSESTLKASLETSGKLIQPSLLDFLK